MIVTACRIAFPRDNSGRDDTVVMVDCSFYYFSGSSGFDSPATTRRRDAASGQSSPEYVVQIFMSGMTRYAYEDTLLILGAFAS